MLTYIPAHLPGTFENFKYEGKKIIWWSKDNPFFFYPYLLVSAYHGLDRGWNREDEVKDKDVVVFGDSGGFQNITMNANLDAIKVLRWQEVNCDVGFSLDMPPFEYEGEKVIKNIVNDSKFKLCMDKTYQNNKIYEKYRESNKLKIYNVIQGHNKERINLWYNKMKEFDFEGFATGGVKPIGDPLKQIVSSLYLYDKGINKNIHILGMSGYDVTPTLVYLSKHIKNLTFDSATYSEGRQYCIFRMPVNPKMRIPFGGREKVATKKWKEVGMDNMRLENFPCFCEVCSKLNKTIKIDKFYENLTAFESSLLTLHNLKTQLNFLDILKTLKNSSFLLKEFVKYSVSRVDRVLDSFNFIDLVVEEGFDKAYEKFKNKIEIEKYKNKTQSLFKF